MALQSCLTAFSGLTNIPSKLQSLLNTSPKYNFCKESNRSHQKWCFRIITTNDFDLVIKQNISFLFLIQINIVWILFHQEWSYNWYHFTYIFTYSLFRKLLILTRFSPIDLFTYIITKDAITNIINILIITFINYIY